MGENICKTYPPRGLTSRIYKEKAGNFNIILFNSKKIACWKTNLHNHFGKLASLTRNKHMHPLRPSNLGPGYSPKKNTDLCTTKNTKYAHSSIIHNGPKLKSQTYTNTNCLNCGTFKQWNTRSVWAMLSEPEYWLPVENEAEFVIWMGQEGVWGILVIFFSSHGDYMCSYMD